MAHHRFPSKDLQSDLVLRSPDGVTVEISRLGASIAFISTPDRSGNIANIVVTGEPYAGATIGRYANRIAGGRFELDGRTHELTLNDGPNTLHGGQRGFDRAIWELAAASDSSAHLRHVSPDADQGFPGELRVDVVFTLSTRGLQIEYRATTDGPTIVNLTNHVYFNLTGRSGRDVSDHRLQVFASRYTPADEALIPTGVISPVENTPFDFRVSRRIGSRELDVNWVLDGPQGLLKPVAHVSDPDSGRVISISTTEPGLQVYTPGARAFTVETQHFADSPHHAGFPSTVLRPGSVYASTTSFEFVTNDRQ